METKLNYLLSGDFNSDFKENYLALSKLFLLESVFISLVNYRFITISKEKSKKTIVVLN
jgi:hypothetical protein